MTRPAAGHGIASISCLALVSLLLPAAVLGQYDSPPPPSAWALQDVTVVHGDGSRQEGVTLVVRDGVVERLGTDVAVPPDARRIAWDEGTLRVYPGFVDGHGDASTSFPAPDREGVESWNPTREVQNFTARRRTADYLGRGGEGLASERRAGWIASVAYPGRGPIPGQPSLVLHRVDARTPRELVLEPSLGLVLAFQGAQGAYPGTLMAVQAFIRQAFLDAEHYAARRSAFGESPRDLETPARDEDLEVLSAAAAGEIPVFFHASGAEGVRRVLALSDEIGFRPVIVGGEGIGPVAAELAARDIPVLLTTLLLRPLEWDPDSDEEPGPAAARERDDLLPTYETARRLEQAGVRFALTSGGEGGSPLPGARRYIEYGLSEEGALRALTLTPAELFGVPGLVRLEEGMAASFVVTDRDLFHEDAEIAWTFVNGVAERGRDPRSESEAAEPAEAIDTDAVVGRWEGTIGAAQGSFPVALIFEEGDGGLVGRVESPQGDRDLGAIEVEGSRITFELPGPMGSLTISGEVADGELSGSKALLQLPDDDVTYPRGDLFIQGLDAVWTATGEVLENASILIRGGVIEAIGPDLQPPGGVEVLDGRGRTAMPGIVDEHSHTAQIGTNEGSAPIVPEIRVIDALNPNNFGIFRAVSGGVTTARIMHGSSNPIGGQSAVIKMRWGVGDSKQLLVPGAPRAVKFALGENVTRKPQQARGPASRFPASRPGVEAVYTQAFTAASEYRDLWEAYRADPASFRAPPRRDLRLEALVHIMEDRIRVHAHSYRADEILMLMRVAERFGFTIENFTHILEGYRIADELREHGAGASTFTDWWQFKLEAYDAIPYNATLMHERGVLTALNSDLGWIQPFLKWEVTKPVQYGGASREDALRMLTLNPATMLGIEDRVGSLAPGKEGDVVILTGDPFDVFSRVEYTVIDGIVYFDSNREEESRGQPINALPAGNDRYVVDNGNAGNGAGRSAGARAQPVDFSGLEPVKARAETIALVGATIHPVSRPAIEDGVLVMRGGRIQAVGARAQVEIPSDARRVDVAGRHLYPGMIDPVTHLGIFEIGAISQATDRGEIGTFNPHIRALGAYQPHGRAPAVARARGITSVLTAQTGGMIEGMGSFVDLEGDTFERAEIRGDAALMVNLPVPSVGPGGGGGWGVYDEHDHDHAAAIEWAGDVLFAAADATGLGQVGHRGEMAGGASAPSSARSLESGAPAQARQSAPRAASMETGRMQELADFFERAREYAAGGGVARRADEPFEANVWGGDAVVLEAMLPVMRGEVPVFFRADSEWQIRHVFLFLEEFPEIEGVVVGGVEAFRLAAELAERDLPVILTRTRNPTPDRNDSVAASQRNAAILHEAGVRFAFGTNESSDVRNLPEHAAMAVAHGLPPAAGLEAVTLRSAELLGFGDEVGSLDPGKRADLLVTDGNPLQQLTRIETMFIGGIEVDPRDNDHSRAYERFRDRVW